MLNFFLKKISSLLLILYSFLYLLLTPVIAMNSEDKIGSDTFINSVPCLGNLPSESVLQKDPQHLEMRSSKGGLVTNFTYNFHSMIPPDKESSIVDGLQKRNSSLRTINVIFNEERGKEVLSALKSNQSIENAELFFFWRKLSSDESNSLMFFVARSPSLNALRLEAYLDDPLLFKFADVLRQNSLALKKLKLGATIKKPKAHPLSKESVEGFFQALGVNNSLKLLQVDFPFPLGSIQNLTEALKLNNTLKVLALPNQELEDEGIISLAEGLKENTSVTEIDLSDNNISDIGAEIILNTLEVNQTLVTLHLAGNPISDSKKAEINKILDKRKTPVFNFSREISLP